MADRTWMYSGWHRGKAPTNQWIENTKLFLDHAFSIVGVAEDNTVKCPCPCAKCRNYFSHERDEIEMHLCYNGFKENYETWTAHGETCGVMSEQDSSSLAHEDFLTDRMDNMLIDLAGQQPPSIEEEPSASAQAFYRMVASADEPVHESTTHSCLSAIARLLAIKSQYNMSITNYDAVLELIHELLPGQSNMCKDFYRSKKLIEGLGMPYVKIDGCKNNCMLYYKDNEQKEKCDFCGTSRYVQGQNKVPHKLLRYLPLTERLQRLYAHEETAKQMRSHSRSTSNFMVHPCDGEAWQHFDKDYPLFASDPRNVRLVFSTDGFTPYGLGAAPYSCWPVFASPLNLPPSKLLKKEYIFLCLVILGSQHPGKKLGVLMQPLIDELIELWEGRLTWDASVKQNFPMRAAFLWPVHDFPALGTVSGWSTHGKLACHICLTDSNAFQLTHGHKPCWFDCHRRFLPPYHEFRFQDNAFRKDTVVLEGPPRRLMGEELLAHMHKNVTDTKNYNKLHNWTHIRAPVLSRWMYPFERNKAPRYDDGASSFVPTCEFDIFQCSGRCISPRGYQTLTGEEYKVVLYYILTKIPEMDDIFNQFDKEQWKSRTKPTEKQLRELRLNGWKSGRGPDFFDWFKTHCMKSSNIHNALRQMSYEFRSKVRTYGIYDINGYRMTLRHIRLRERTASNTNASNSQRTNCDDSNSSGNVSQRTTGENNNSSAGQRSNTNEANSATTQSKKRGRAKRARTSLKVPPSGRKVQLEPHGDLHFKYVGTIPKEYKYGTQLGVILKREYPGLVEDKDSNGVITRSRPALDWEDYYLMHDGEGVTSADRVKREFWRLFEVTEPNRAEANHILEGCARRKVKDNMYQARVDAVKIYYDDQGEELDDKLACSRELTLEQYLASRVDWFSPTVWPHICRYWCSKEFKQARSRGQASRLKSLDVAQNRGGSRPFTETRQYLEHKFGPQKATIMNTYAAMKSGMKNLDESGCSGAISSQKAQKRLDAYCDGLKKAHPEDWQDIDLDESVLYNTSGGMPHGRLSIAAGAVKKGHIISVAKATNLKPSSYVAYRNMLFAEMGRDLPEWFQQGQTQAHTQGNTGLEDAAMDDLIGHGNTGGSNDGENICGDSNGFGYNEDGDGNYASGGGSH
ncbi:hypothetical protein ACQ4PT_020280 [Festuca glaucescens]